MGWEQQGPHGECPGWDGAGCRSKRASSTHISERVLRNWRGGVKTEPCFAGGMPENCSLLRWLKGALQMPLFWCLSNFMGERRPGIRELLISQRKAQQDFMARYEFA